MHLTRIIRVPEIANRDYLIPHVILHSVCAFLKRPREIEYSRPLQDFNLALEILVVLGACHV